MNPDHVHVQRDLLRPDEVCNLLGCSRSHLRKIDRTWPFKVRLSHKVVRYRGAEFRKWLEVQGR
jgi:predicted DNA-binding transcriptional regulator AlpA